MCASEPRVQEMADLGEDEEWKMESPENDLGDQE